MTGSEALPNKTRSVADAAQESSKLPRRAAQLAAKSWIAPAAATCLLLALLVRVALLTSTYTVHVIGIDSAGPYEAAGLVGAGSGSIYSVFDFVYLPTTPLLLLPLVHASPELVTGLIAGMSAAAIAIAAVVLGAVADRQHRAWGIALGALVGLIALRSQLVLETLLIGNFDAILAAFAAVVAVAWLRGRWNLGLAVLFVSLAIKPALVPLLLLPLLARRWRALAVGVGATLAVVAVSAILTPGGQHVLSLPGFLLRGSTIRNTPFNISYTSQAAVYGHPLLGTLARIALILVAIPEVVRFARANPATQTLTAPALSVLVLTTTFLAGGLGENHFLLLVLSGLLVAAQAGGAGRYLLLAGFALGLRPRSGPGSLHVSNLSFVAALTLIALGAALCHRRLHRRAEPDVLQTGAAKGSRRRVLSEAQGAWRGSDDVTVTGSQQRRSPRRRTAPRTS